MPCFCRIMIVCAVEGVYAFVHGFVPVHDQTAWALAQAVFFVGCLEKPK
jgi:hypothetical protein